MTIQSRIRLSLSGLFILLCFMGMLNWLSGIILLAALAAMLTHAFLEAKRHRRANADEEEVEGADPSLGWGKISMFLVLGMVGLPLGANLLVEGSTNIARAYGITETVIGLTLVAIGTSLPELATTVMAALRKQADVALGNVIGSNMFNLLAIMGVASLVGDIPVASGFLSFDLWIMLGASLLLIPFSLFRFTLNRVWGAGFLAVYAFYMAFLLG